MKPSKSARKRVVFIHHANVALSLERPAEQGLATVLELSGPEAMAATWTAKRWLEY